MTVDQVAVLGVGTHPWGKWGRNFVEYGGRGPAALADAGVDAADIQFIAGADTMRNGYPGHVAGATFAKALGWRHPRHHSAHGACASRDDDGDRSRPPAHPRGLCDVVFWSSAPTPPRQGFG